MRSQKKKKKENEDFKRKKRQKKIRTPKWKKNRDNKGTMWNIVRLPEL
jgi:hypothetical protein